MKSELVQSLKFRLTDNQNQIDKLQAQLSKLEHTPDHFIRPFSIFCPEGIQKKAYDSKIDVIADELDSALLKMAASGNFYHTKIIAQALVQLGIFIYNGLAKKYNSFGGCPWATAHYVSIVFNTLLNTQVEIT